MENKFDKQVVAPIVYEWFRQNKKDEESGPKGYIRCSSLGYCPMRAVHYMVGHEPNYDVNSLLVFNLGDTVHRLLQSILSTAGKIRAVEQEFKDEKLGLIGHTDGIIDDEVIDFKSISPDAKRYRRELPYEHHVRQVHGYMHLTGLRKARLVYVDKAYGLIDEYPVQWNEAVWWDIQHEIRRIKELRDTYQYANEVPPADPEAQQIWDRKWAAASAELAERIPAWQCKRCPFFQQCAIGVRVVARESGGKTPFYE